MSPPRRKTALLTDAIVTEHFPGSDHPESPARYEAVRNSLAAAGLMQTCPPLTPRSATKDELAICHERRYIDLVEAEIASGAHELSTGDTSVGSESWAVSLRAVGGVLQAVDAVMQGRASNAFCAVRPPGHHASQARGMGFCLFNNIAIGTRYAQQRYGVERVLLVDWDVHHGNGTQDIFYRDGSVFFFSTHQSSWYPGTGNAAETGSGPGIGTTLNCPLPAGSGRDAVLGSFTAHLLPAAESFRPDLVMISAGFDSRRGDPLGQFLLDDKDFADLTGMMLTIADKHANGRVVSVLEGGYNLSGLAAAATAHVKSMVDPPAGGMGERS